MGKATYIKISGTWRQVSQIWKKVSGVWRSGTLSFIKTGGVWKQCIAYAPAAPTGLGLSQPSFGDHIQASWNTVTDATGYKLYRTPWWDGGTWQTSWKEVFQGTSLTANDDIQLDADPNVPYIGDGDPFDYQVSAYNDAGEGSRSGSVRIYWTNM